MIKALRSHTVRLRRVAPSEFSPVRPAIEGRRAENTGKMFLDKGLMSYNTGAMFSDNGPMS